jgi:DNA processing protein
MSASPIDPDELAAWLRLLDTPGIGRNAARRLLAAFGSAQAVCQAPLAARRRVVGEALARALDEPPPAWAARVERTQAWLADSPRHHVLTLGDPAYPPLLLATDDPPLLLYAIGDLARLQAPWRGQAAPSPWSVPAWIRSTPGATRPWQRALASTACC